MVRLFKRYFIWIAAVCAVTICFVDKKTPPSAQNSSPPTEPQSLSISFECTGMTKSSHAIEICAKVEGYLQTIDYTEGEVVETNDLLFQLDPRQFEAILEEARGEFARATALAWRAKKTTEKIEHLFSKHEASEEDLEDAQADQLTAEAAVTIAKAKLSQAELNLSHTQITSPIKGVVSQTTALEGALIKPGVNGLLTTISVIDPIVVVLKLDHPFVFPEGQQHTFSLELSDGITFSHTGNTVFDRESLTMRIELPNPEGKLLPGQRIHVHLK